MLNRVRKSWVALVVTGALFAQQAGCSLQAEEDLEPQVVATAELPSGQDLFLEVMFPNETAAELVPELSRIYEASGLREMSAEDLESLDTIKEMILVGIEELDPEFFGWFRDQITSGDVKKVDFAIMQAADVLTAALSTWSTELSAILSPEGIAKMEARLDKSARDGARPALLDKLRDLAPEHVEVISQLVDEQLAELPRQNLSEPAPYVITSPISSTVNVVVAQTRPPTFPPNVAVAVNRALVRPPNLALTTNTQINRAFALAVVQQNQINTRVAQWADRGTATAVAVALYVVVAVAVAVAVAAVYPSRDGGAGYLNGDSSDLFHDQMVASITRAYAR